MRMLRKNQQSLKYSNQMAELPVYETDLAGNIRYDGYTDGDGNFFPYLDEDGNKKPLMTGRFEVLYGEAESFWASISMSGGEAEAVEYGLSQQDFEAVIVYSKKSVPIVEGSLIWYKSNVKYKYGGEEIEVEIDGNLIKTRALQPTSADYQVIKVADSLNVSRAILKAINK